MEYKWKELTKKGCKNHQILNLTVNSNSRFSQVAFDLYGEILIAIDNLGHAYIIDLAQPIFAYKKIGFVGPCTFVQFNPINNEDVLVGLNTNELKVAQIADVTCYSILQGHTLPAKKASFFKQYCLTASNNEAIIWCLQSYSKIHHLKILSDDLSIKTAIISNIGLITILYKSNYLQCWTFGCFEDTKKINLNEFRLRNVRDLTYSKNGQMLILGGSDKILVFNTQNWKTIKTVNYSKNGLNLNKIKTIEKPLNFIVATLLSDSNLEFFDLSSSNVIRHCECKEMTMIKRIDVSENGRYFAHVKTSGELIVSNLENIFLKEKHFVSKNKETSVSRHNVNDHLRCIQTALKHELSLERLLPILKEFGQFSDKYRPLIWSTIMNLPSNEEAYLALTKIISESSDEDSIERYSLADKRKSSLLGTIIKCLIRWCPLLEHTEFIPGLIFPFIVVFQKNPVLAFETSLMIILNYCQKWFEYHPLPPFNILGIIENMLLEADPQLLSFFCDRGITSTDYAWPLLSTIFSEILPISEWLVLWDHLLAHGKPSMLLCCVVAFNLCCRTVIIGSIKTLEDVQRFYTHQSQIQAKKIWKVAQNLDKLIPTRIHPSQYIRNSLIKLPASDVYPPLPQLEYPQILVEEFQLGKIKELKKQEMMERKQEQKKAELAEKRRLEIESEAFKKRVHLARLKELRRCYEQLASKNVNDNKDEDVMWNTCQRNKSNEQIENDIQSLKKTVPIKGKATEIIEINSMKQQVQQLENEACNLIIRNKRF